MHVFVAIINSTASQPINNISLRFAVLPSDRGRVKQRLLALEAAFKNSLPAHSPFLSQINLSQILLVCSNRSSSSGGVDSVKLKFQFSYQLGSDEEDAVMESGVSPELPIH